MGGTYNKNSTLDFGVIEEEKDYTPVTPSPNETVAETPFALVVDAETSDAESEEDNEGPPGGLEKHSSSKSGASDMMGDLNCMKKAMSYV